MHVPPGHADMVCAALFEDDTPALAPRGSGGSNLMDVKLSTVGEFAALGSTGYPTAVGWKSWKPSFRSHMRSKVSQGAFVVMQTVLKDPALPQPPGWDPESRDNFVLFIELINGGSGVPERLKLQLPMAHMDEEHGMECLQWITLRVEATSDDAAEIVVEWLTDPPMVPDSKKYLLGEALAEWRSQGPKADQLDVGLSDPQKRLSLKKLRSRLPEAVLEMATLKAKCKRKAVDPDEMLSSLDGLAEQYASVQGAKQGSNRLTVLLGAPAEGGSKSAIRRKSKQSCWAHARVTCTRGDACRFMHYGKAGTGQQGAAPKQGGLKAAQCHSVSTGAGSCGTVVLGLSYAAVAARAGETSTGCQRAGVGSGCTAVGRMVVAGLESGAETGAVDTLGAAESTCLRVEAGSVMSASEGERGSDTQTPSLNQSTELDPTAEPFRPGAGAEAEHQAGAEAEQQWASATPEEQQKFSNWLVQMSAGVAAKAGVRTAVVVEYVWDCLQERGRRAEKETAGRSGSMQAAGIVAGTGATVTGLGRKHVHRAKDIREMTEPVRIEGAGGQVAVDTVGDLEITGPLDGAMNGAMVFYDCVESAMPIVPVCEEMDLGFQIAQGGGRERVQFIY